MGHPFGVFRILGLRKSDGRFGNSSGDKEREGVNPARFVTKAATRNVTEAATRNVTEAATRNVTEAVTRNVAEAVRGMSPKGLRG